MAILDPMETQSVEYKQIWRDDFLKEICGFANAQGGTLYIGIADNGEVVGVENPHKLQEDIPNKIVQKLGIVCTVNQHTKDGRVFLEIVVEPNMAAIAYNGAYYIRSGATKQELTGSALEEFLLRKRGRTWDSVPQPYLKVEDLDEASIRMFKADAVRSQRMSESDLEVNRAELMDKLHLVEGSYLKRAAALLFHADPEKFITGACVKIGFFNNQNQLLYQDEVHGSLFQQMEKTMDFLTTKYTKAYIRYEGIQRIDEQPVPRDALREAVLNALIHKDYSSFTPIQISVYDDKMMIWNTAILPQNWTAETLTQKHGSRPHNPDIAATFFRAGEVEAWGQGIERVQTYCTDYGCPVPEWRFDGAGIWTVFYYKTQTESSGKSEQKSGEKSTLKTREKSTLKGREKSGLKAEQSPENHTESTLKTREKNTKKTREKTRGKSTLKSREKSTLKGTLKIVMEIIASNPDITLDKIAEQLGKNPRGIDKHIKNLREQGLIRRIGPDKGGHWEITNQ